MKNIYVLSATFDSFSAKNRTPRPWALTSQPDLRPGLDLPVGPAHKALVHPVVIPLNAEDLDGEE